jgi:DNA-binding transcriptional LysR family regulator
LIERKTTGVELTPAGQLLLAHANATLARAADAEEELRQLNDGTLPSLRVAASSSAAAALMPTAIVEFRARRPRAAIELVEPDREASLDQIRRGELDLAVVVRSPSPEQETGVEIKALPDDYIDVLLPADHELAGAVRFVAGAARRAMGRFAPVAPSGSTGGRTVSPRFSRPPTRRGFGAGIVLVALALGVIAVAIRQRDVKTGPAPPLRQPPVPVPGRGGGTGSGRSLAGA